MLKEYIPLFLPVLIGSMCGEVLFQSNRHMVMKWRNILSGWLYCIEHCIIYTSCILFFLYLFTGKNPINCKLIGSIFVVHFIIDKCNIGMLWMKYIKCEKNPFYSYYKSKLYEKHGAIVDDDDSLFTEFVKKHTVLELDEDTLNTQSFYIYDYLLVSNVLHILLVYFVVIWININYCIF